MSKQVDIVVLGATGFTGKCVVKILSAISQKYCNITWAIAGRSKEKLQDLSMEINTADKAVKSLIIKEVNIRKEKSLRNLLIIAKIVINCTGPNCLLSPLIVKACIETGTHYVDISAEIFHILCLYRDYYKAAEDANVLIIPSCGFSSIPMQMGMVYLKRQFKGVIDSVECYTELFLPSWYPQTYIHNGTWTSLVYVMKTFDEHLALWRKMFPPVEPQPEELKNKSFFHRHNGRVWFPWPGPDTQTVEMTQQYLHKRNKIKPIHFKAYSTVQYIYQLFIIPIIFLYYYLCYFKCFRSLLINFSRIFTFGMMSERGPTYETRQNTKYSFVFNAKGYDINQDLKSKPTKSLSIKVTGQDPGYDTTAVAIIMCAITILEEPANMPKGGVIMPGAAFYKTDLVNRLANNGYNFEVLN